MSEVLALKAGAKRSFDAMDIENPPVPCQQRRITFLSPGNSAKRVRNVRDMDSLIRKARKDTYMKMLPSSASKDRREVLDRHLRRKRSQSKEKLFSLDDVKELVRRVLADRELQLENDFQMHLCKTLDEQSEQFTRFREAYITRQFRNKSDVSYVS
mmetsp:Transcript_12552/g.38355  ORF Transcript_12552/g.38355 Transcript_12552/m.38355 type:complete len:156 (+) Transcript_12552:321-788(+)